MIARIALWFATSKTGRTLAAIGASVLGALLILWRVFAAGKAAQAAKHDRASLDNLRKRSATDDKVNRMDSGDRRRELGKWMRDGER